MNQKLGIGISLILILLAIFIGFKTFKKGTAGPMGIKPGLKVWVKCGDVACGNEYEMEKRDYWEKVIAIRGPMSTQEVFLDCPKCNKKSVYLANKCPKCKTVFKPTAGLDDFPDRCPKCKYSEMEGATANSTNSK